MVITKERISEIENMWGSNFDECLDNVLKRCQTGKMGLDRSIQIEANSIMSIQNILVKKGDWTFKNDEEPTIEEPTIYEYEEILRVNYVNRISNTPAEIAVISVQAGKSGGGKYRWAVDIRVVKTLGGHYRNSRHCLTLKEWNNVDKRYTGEKSSYGKAYAEAEAYVAELERGN